MYCTLQLTWANYAQMNILVSEKGTDARGIASAQMHVYSTQECSAEAMLQDVES